MKIFFILLLLASTSFAQNEIAPDQYIDLIPLHLQYRFEDSSSQERTNHQYQAYSLAAQYSSFRIEFEFDQFYDKTGNSSLNIEQTIREYDLGFGYRVYQLMSDDRRLSINAFTKLWLGQTQTNIDTNLLSSQSTTQSDKDNVLGAGVSLLGRISYFLIETDFKILNSKNMNPQNVPVFGIKIGAGLPY